MTRIARVVAPAVAAATIAAVTVTGATVVSPAPPVPSAAAAEGQTPAGDVRRVVYVGNNWAGTADLLAPGSFERLARVDVVPDRDERMAEITASPDKLAYFLAIREAIGEGHDQLVDDLYTTDDGRMLIVSRPSFADVVAISLRTKRIVWRFPVEGYRSDHMAISPDGTRVAVSASTAKVVHVLRTSDGKELGRFPSGGSPHENVYLDGGRTILHASIGMVYSPLDQPEMDSTKDERVLQFVDARSFEVKRRINVRRALDDAGLTRVSHAVRPLTLSPDERKIYLQVSFFHGFLEMERSSGRITRVKRLPNLVPDMPREQYVLDSAHHGIAMNPGGTKICVAGTMSDYATVVDRATFRRGPLLKRGLKPYWVTPSADGKSCYISWSGSDKVSRISYATGRVTRSVRVGDHPQRIRNGFLRVGWLRHLR
ncbi:serine/threonine protein kinase [Nocardioides guangzhouensis]|uniref:Serine/threonine protein kinase n=1 Tax=Nocardioides guangzhouensis TaxID=2497878 RepID=A0A4Q4ZGC2_9ACTN|nr:serine/threonine protein kinase [Nocardioides guangzhouensis]RYP87217.1 serine/threonine protein kinase [Nocardioides guangzhouensis]